MQRLMIGVSQAVSQSGRQSVRQAVSQSGRQSVRQAGGQSGRQAVSQAGSQSVRQAVSQSVSHFRVNYCCSRSRSISFEDQMLIKFRRVCR